MEILPGPDEDNEEIDSADVEFDLLDRACEDAYRLADFADDWPRELVEDALLALVERGLVAVLVVDEPPTQPPMPQERAAIEQVVRDASSWQLPGGPAIVATREGHAEYRRLSALRFD